MKTPGQFSAKINNPDALQRLRVIANHWEVSAEFDNAAEFAAFLVGLADRGGVASVTENMAWSGDDAGGEQPKCSLQCPYWRVEPISTPDQACPI